MARMLRAVVAATLAGLAVLGARPAAAQSAGEHIDRFGVLIEVSPDGTLHIHESITYDFGVVPRHGIERDLVRREHYDGRYDRRYRITDVQVTAGAGTPSALKTTNEGPYVHLRIGDPDRTITGVHRYEIDYRVGGAPRTFPDHDELFWDAIGHQWVVPIDRAVITIRTPAVTRVACFAGPEGSTLPCDHAEVTTQTQARFSHANLGPFSGVTTVVAMPKGTIQPPPEPILDKRWSAAEAFSITRLTVALTAGILLLGIGGVILLATRRGRDRRFTGSAVDAAMGNVSGDEEPRPLFSRLGGPVEFVPPDAIRPGQVGILLDEHANLLDVTASIVDLAVRGWLTITELEPTGFFRRNADYELTRTDGDTGTDGGKGELLPYEQKLLNELFRTGTTVKLSDLKYQFRASLTKIQDDLYDDSVKQGWFRVRPDKTRRAWTRGAVLVIVVGGALTWLLAAKTSFGIVPLAIILLGLVVHAAAGVMPARTGKGTAMLSRVRGFRRLFDEGEEDTRARFAEQHDIFSQYLPYAVVFGCTEKWAKAFEGIDAEQLQTSSWFHGNRPFDAMVLAHSIDDFGTTATGTMYASMPSSSGGSGFGGSSGGGGGGGGGGSW
jgi:uncharacterized membrane protein YgcG